MASRSAVAGSVIEPRVDAFEFLSHLAAEVSRGTVNLPCFPDIVLRIRKALSDPRNTPEKTVRSSVRNRASPPGCCKRRTRRFSIQPANP